ncbi:Ubiquinone biosynthesis O-methyltransferase [Rubripirellula amarantea]|uniref:Ubiquinone biosynthesis O-methyltransferase n=1 Tax=Rubripirellula amarantea TaxID=2527999 RepID=A0A5C5WR87_9BACT|nr:class I SAM-dependent methyltransferase [Rubripirellula amarantea]TWT52689.1 Ubiquinone biosynthesis O-methyltransferase [Rubripirellula amarantea]
MSSTSHMKTHNSNVCPDWLLRQLTEDWEHDGGQLRSGNRTVPIIGGIPRFVADESYSRGNFSKLRDEFPKLQLDNVAGGKLRMDTILDRTRWDPSVFQDKLVLECGCGAGPDTQILRHLGSRVIAADLAGVDTARANLAGDEGAAFLQASIVDLPFKKASFDIVFCHRVLQHTPNPDETLQHILQFVKPDGLVFVHSYARTIQQMMHWKYVLRPITTRMDPDRLLKCLRWTTPPLLGLSTALRKAPPEQYLGKLLMLLSQNIIPVYNRRFARGYGHMDSETLKEHAIHDTFDALSPKHDHPMSAKRMREIASTCLNQPFEIEERGGITLLRSKVQS